MQPFETGAGEARPRLIQGFRLSAQQAHLWRLTRQDRSPYHARCTVRIEGELDEAALRAAVDDLVERHEILRTRFELLPGMSVPLQVIGEPAVLTTALTRLSTAESRLVLELPPLCADAPSLARLTAEIAGAYAARLGKGEPLPEVAMQYADFASWQHELMESEDGREEAAGWTAAGLAAAGAPALPWSADTEEGAPFLPESLPLELPAGALAAGPDFLLACWAALLARLTGESRVAVAVARDGRGYDELAEAIGLFTRYLPVLLETPPSLRFDRLPARAAEAVEEAEARQDGFSWDGLRGLLDMGEAALFPVYAFEHAAVPGPVTAAGVRFSLAERSVRGERFLALLAVSADRAELGYDAARLRPEDARRLGRCLETLAASALDGPRTVLGDLGLLAAEERRHVLFGLNDTAADLGAGLLHGPFLAQTAATPGRVAVRFAGGTLTYAELAERSAALARRLRALGVGPEMPVALCVERSPEMVVGLLGILRAGGAYVPLDPEHPEERRAAILAEVRPPVVLTRDELTAPLPLPVPAGASLVPEAALAPALGPHHLAYVIYTSGSTGRPKGVMVTHGAITNRLLWMQREHPLGEDDRVLQKTPYGFDASIWEIFLPLSVGAELVLARPGGHQDMAYLAAAVAEQGITVLQLVPSLLRPFLDEPAAAACTGLRRVFCGGEELPADLARRFHEVCAGAGAGLYNLYGPTEAAIDATSWPCRDGIGRRSVPIGRPIANVRVYVAASWEDGGLHALPAGVPGELCIGGAGLARGYLGRPEQTAERFVPDPFSGVAGGRLYRTGDRARHRPGGELEYLGRADRQVKIRGVRIEPREIEAVLREHPRVRDAVVAVRGEGDQRRLVAWVVPAGPHGPDPGELRGFLRRRLPEALVPAAFAGLPSLPLTANGKLDVAALPDPAELRPAQGPVPPRTETEAVLAGLWAEVLGVPRVGAHDNFFALGGHSLSATQLISRVRKGLGVDLAVHQLFDAPTVAGLAAELEAALRGGEASRLPAIEPAPRREDMPLSFAQQRLWFFERLRPGTPVFNILVALGLRGALDVTALSQALDEVVRRHEALRTTFPDRRGLPVQVVGEPWPVPLPVVDLQALPEPARRAEAERHVAAEAGRPFDLARGPLLRVLLLRLGSAEHVVPFTVHHIVSDAWSSGVLTREVAALYRAFTGGEPAPAAALPPLPVQYADFAAWQQRWLAGDGLAEQTAWWTRRLAGAPPLLALPADRPRPRELSFRGATLPMAFSAELTEALDALARRHGVTLFMTLLAGFQLLLRHLSGQHDVVVGTDVANRNRLETEGLIGFFINQLVLRTDLSGDPTFAELLARVREVTLGAYAHQDTPFEQLVEALKVPRTLAHAPLFQVKLFLENTPAAALELPGLALEPLAVGSDVAKLDLTLALWQGRGLTGWINYSTDLFDARRIERLTGHLEALLAAAAARPEARLSELEEVVAARERREREEDKKALQKLSLGKLRALAPRAPAPKINDGEG